jgi:pilus assembly protein CpaC
MRAFDRCIVFTQMPALLVLIFVASSVPVVHAQASDASLTSNAALQSQAIEAFSDGPAGGEALHMLVGRSRVINTKLRVRRVYITNPQVLDSYTPTPHQIVVTAKQTGLSTLMISDELGVSHFYVIQADIDTGSVSSAMRQAFPQEQIQAQGDQGRIVLSGTVSTSGIADAAGKLAGLYAKDISNTIVVSSTGIKQVELKVRVVEVDRSKLDQFGFNFFSAGGKNLAATTTTQFPSTLNVGSSGSGGSSSTVGDVTVAVSNPLNFLFYSSKLNVGATLQDLATKQVLQILAEPTITTISGQKANFLSGGEFPFPVVQGGVGGLATITIQFRSYGVKVEFTPVVNPDGTIDLKVAPEVSALDFTNSVTISGYTIPALSTRRAETEVVLNSGESFAISGLLDNRTTDALSRTPGIASVPILGELFKSKNINHSTTELIVIVTPTVVSPLTRGGVLDEPARPIPMLDPQIFDKTLPSNKTQKSDQPK